MDQAQALVREIAKSPRGEREFSFGLLGSAAPSKEHLSIWPVKLALKIIEDTNMPLYSTVDEGYEVEIYRTLKAVCTACADTSLYVVPEDEFDDEAPQVPATASAIKKALRSQGEVRLSDDGGRDWKYKITRHT